MNKHSQAPHLQLAMMSRWYVVSRAIHTVAGLGLANFMSDLPTPVETLAEKTGTKRSELDRLLRFLSAYDIFDETSDGYRLTPLSKPLRDDDPHSIRDVLRMADECWWQAFSQMDKSLITGESGFSYQHGDDFFSFLSKHPDKQKNFDTGMAKLSTYDDMAIAKALNFSEFKSLTDMGGGFGGLSQAIHACYPQLNITLFDTPSVIDSLKEKQFPKEISLVSGDFFKTIPKTQAYIFKGVLHDFNDENMRDILANCHEQAPQNATLLIAEQVLPDDKAPHPNKTMDIVMMVLLGGRQRTLSEWKKSIEPAGFELINSIPTNSLFTLMVFKRYGSSRDTQKK